MTEVVEAPPEGQRKAPANRTLPYLLNDLCDLLGVARYHASPGSSPSRIFVAAAERAQVPAGSMPEVGAAIATKAGLAWGPGCDNREWRREATGVTSEGVTRVVEALTILSKR